MSDEPKMNADVAGRFASLDFFDDLKEQMGKEAVDVENIVQIPTTELQDLINEAKSVLSNAHSTRFDDDKFGSMLEAASVIIRNQIKTIKKLQTGVDQETGFYRWHSLWNKQMKDGVFVLMLYIWLGGNPDSLVDSRDSSESSFRRGVGTTYSLQEVGLLLNIPTNSSGKSDLFHITIEEYLHALISLVDDLSRLSRNAVILSQFDVPARICSFVSSVHAGFLQLTLKNDGLRKRFDSLKYKVRETEDVVYDLSLRGLLKTDVGTDQDVVRKRARMDIDS